MSAIERPRPARAGAGAALRVMARIYPVLLLLCAWGAAAASGFVRPLFLPGLGEVLAQFWALLAAGDIVQPLAVSLFRAFAGLFLAVVFGVALGLLMWRSRLALWLFDPLVSLGFPAPKIAFVPIFILWFGIGDLSKILLVAFTCVFPMIVAAYHGAAGVNRTVIWSAEALGTPERMLLYRIVLPAALPSIFSGVRVTAPVALIMAFTAEMIAGGGGVGGALMFAQRFFETPTVFVYIIIMLAIGCLFDWLMLRLRARLLVWTDEVFEH